MVNKSTDHENDVTEVQFVFFFPRACVFPKNYNFKTVKVIVKKQIDNNCPMVCTLIDHSNEVKMFKTLQ